MSKKFNASKKFIRWMIIKFSLYVEYLKNEWDKFRQIA